MLILHEDAEMRLTDRKKSQVKEHWILYLDIGLNGVKIWHFGPVLIAQTQHPAQSIAYLTDVGVSSVFWSMYVQQCKVQNR